MRRPLLPLLCLCLLLAVPAVAKKKPDKGDEADAAAEAVKPDAGTLSGLAFRELGPALTSGRISDLSIDPEDRRTWYVAVASGGVWKTTDAGITWAPIFDGEGSYSIGCITVDPWNRHTVWVGTGENNSQRSVGYGDGVYKSTDGGSTWANVGLGESEHIAEILVDPRDSDVVWVAAQGPLWASGGDRGLYQTTDGGETWERKLHIDDDTGVTDIAIDPRDADVIYAASYQRRRHVWTLIDGGPGSGIHKSTDGGETWRELERGLPSGDIGRIGLALSPAAPDVLYAVVEATDDEGGFYRSTDRGASWHKQSSYVSGSPQYYQELFPDPHDVHRVYSVDTWLKVTDDGGASFQSVPETTKHVDSHVVWIDPEDTDRLLVGCDGGLYETFDRGGTWRYFANLPITQFYKLAIDDAEPFYNVYGGTQDNFTLGGPSRTTSANGIANRDWFVTVGGDGFQTRVEPGNPDILYSQYQNGGLVRFDRKSGEMVDIQPQPEPGEDGLRWNWDSPLTISPHSKTRLYYGANRLFRSDDRGDTWRPVSPDLTRQLDRNTLPVMGRVWSVDAVAKNRSTSYYGNLVSLAESPLAEGLLYVGSDDGLIQVSEDGGETWRREESFPGVPASTYVNDLEASLHDADTVFAAFNNHKMGDFLPYLLKSTDRGRTWTSIAGEVGGSGLPERGSVYAVTEDDEMPGLLFAGTEFGVFTSLDDGGRWIQLKAGVPTVAVRDLALQRREDDLVLGTFGRGFYVLDDYSPLRHLGAAVDAEAALLPPRKAWLFVESVPLGLPGKSFQGDGYYVAPNPPFGAVFTYHLKDGLQTRRNARRDAEKEIAGDGGDVHYPTWEELRAEDREEKPAILLTVRDADGHVVRRLTGPTGAGLHRVAWDLRWPDYEPARLSPFVAPNPFVEPPRGPLVVPGTYNVGLSRRVDGVETALGEPQEVVVEALALASLPADDRAGLLAFQRQTGRLQAAVLGAESLADETADRLEHIRAALGVATGATAELDRRARELEERLADVRVELSGDRTIRRRAEPTPPSISSRVGRVTSAWTSTSAATSTHRRNYAVAAKAFETVLAELRGLVTIDLPALEDELEAIGAPWTPGRVPSWTPEDETPESGS